MRFYIKGTNSELDECEVECSDVRTHYVRYDSKIEHIRMREIICFADDEGLDLIRGLWINDGFLLPVFDESDDDDIANRPGKHIRTVSYILNDYNITVVEYEDRMQCAVLKTATDKILLSCYKDSNYFGSIKTWAEECKDEKDVLEFIEKVNKIND